MRLFLALQPPPPVQQQVHDQVAAARDGLPAARWVRTEQLHLTLIFFGELPAAAVADLDRALGPVFAATAPLRLRCGAVGAFPPRGPARVLWLGVGPDGEVADLHRRCARALANLEDAGGEPLVSPDPRPYRPHLTFGRCRSPWRRADVQRLAAAVDAGDLTFRVTEGTLFHSQLDPRGARHRAVSTYPMENLA